MHSSMFMVFDIHASNVTYYMSDSDFVVSGCLQVYGQIISVVQHRGRFYAGIWLIEGVRLIYTFPTGKRRYRPNYCDISSQQQSLPGRQPATDLSCRDMWNEKTCSRHISSHLQTFKDVQLNTAVWLIWCFCCAYFMCCFASLASLINQTYPHRS